MCLGLPGLIVAIEPKSDPPMGTVDFGGATRNVCLLYTPEAGVNDYVIIHAGFSIGLLDEEEAEAALALFDELDLGDVEPEVAS